MAVDTDIETKELTVQNQDIEKPEKGESITIEDDKEEIKNEGTDNEEIKITVEEEDNQQDSSSTVVVEEEETQGETNSDLELSDSNRSRSSSSSKSRASIRYLETIQKTVNNIEEKSDAEEPKKREKRVSLAAQRYLAATSIGSLDDKDVIKEEENTDDKDVEVKDEPKIISDVQETEQEVIQGA